MPTIEQAKNWYPILDPVHGFDHVLRVYALAVEIARREGADEEIVQAAALLHDAHEQGQDITSEVRQNHHLASADLAERTLQAEGWKPARIDAVRHCILAHRFRDESTAPLTIEAKALFDADKLDAIGAVGAARAIGYALQAGMPIYARPSERFLQTGITEPDEPHSAFHEYCFKLAKIIDRLQTQTGLKLALERQRIMVAYFESLAREMDSGIDLEKQNSQTERQAKPD